MKTFNFQLLLLCFFLFSNFTFCQKNFVSGYIIDNKQEKVEGFIDYREWSVNPDKIRFKKTEKGTIRSYSPIDIKEFSAGNDIYISGIVDRETTSLKDNEQEYDSELKLQRDTAFLQTLFKGSKELYYHVTKYDRENFYIRNNGNLELLVCKNYLVERNDKKVDMMQNKTYITQLSTYLEDCNDIGTQVRSAEYNMKSIYSLFQNYFKCFNDQNTFIKKRTTSNIEFGAIAGVSLTSVNFESDLFPYLTGTEFSKSIAPTVGGYINIVLPRNRGKWAFYNELLVGHYGVQGDYFDFTNDEYFSNSDIQFTYTQLKVNSFLRFKHELDKIDLFVNAGLTNNFALRVVNNREIDEKFYSIETIKNELAIRETRNHEIGLTMGLGATYNRFLGEFRFEYGNGMSDYPVLKSRTNKFYLIFGYQLYSKKK